MPINPIQFAKDVNEQFLNYQLTAFPLSDPDLAGQARELLRGGYGNSPLFNGPHVSLSKSYKTADDLRKLADDGFVHDALPGLTEFPVLFSHQAETLRAVKNGKHCLVATGTGSGKTEAFLYPILDHCLRLRDAEASDGITAVLVYPMNALAHDQLERLRGMLVGSGISFGMYVGSTPTSKSDLQRQVHRMSEGEGRREYERYKSRYADGGEEIPVSPPEERLTEEEMSEDPPRILLTNIHQLEFLLTRGKDLEMFVDAPLRYLVFDEAHTYTGVRGAEVSCLIRRLRAFCDKSPDEVTCIGTSATVTNLEDEEEAAENAADFAHRFFGIDANNVELVKETYEDQEFPADRYTPDEPDEDRMGLLDRCMEALDRNDSKSIRDVVSELTGRRLTTAEPWPQALYSHLKSNDYVYALYHHLSRPCYLREAVQRILAQIGRGGESVAESDEAELLCYLVLGAAAERDGSPLLRPQVHYFVRGMQGAVVTFGEGEERPYRPELSLSLKDAVAQHDVQRAACPRVMVCKNCGQHFLEAHYHDFQLKDGRPTGGTAIGETAVWEPADEAKGQRVLLTDRFLSEEAGGPTSSTLEEKRFPIHFCRHCGALHLEPGTCQNPKCQRDEDLVRLWGIVLKRDQMTSCPTCGYRGGRSKGRQREPIRPLRAITVADVHILAQNMLNAVQNRNLIVFTDNRQDAAFQAGWMKDHARRYRLRHLIVDYLRSHDGVAGVGDVVESLYNYLIDHPNVARSLVPEVYEEHAYEYFGQTLKKALRKFLRMNFLRELATGFKQRDSLENWGVMRVVYAGVEPDSGWIQKWSDRLDMSPQELVNGVSTLLDNYRRGNLLWDEKQPIFSRWWHESDEEVQQGFIPYFDFPPQGLKKFRAADDNKNYVRGALSRSGEAYAQNFVSKWGLDELDKSDFLDSLWDFLIGGDVPLLKPVTLRGGSGRALSGASGTRQVNAGKLGLIDQWGRYVCTTCQQVHPRPTPGMACSRWRCDGRLEEQEPPEDDYNLAMLEEHFTMVQAAEHSGQVPGQVREELEDEFKDEKGKVNCLVSTPTLELGVDIGDLDMILMRNVPPKPSNYWQRAGRAGRRHRMAVVYTYARRSDHDSYFFEDPMRMLDGRIETPQFNLRNDVMVRKHVHAAIVSELIRMSRQDPENGELSEEEVEELQTAYSEIFPSFIATYLFEFERKYRDEPYSADPLREVIERYNTRFQAAVRQAFSAHWPAEDQEVVSDRALEEYVNSMPDELQRVLNRMHRRLIWAVETQRELLAKKQREVLDKEETSVMWRCDRYIKRLRQQSLRNYTLRVLADEGFLPGYGMYETGVKAFAQHRSGAVEQKDDFELDRPPAIALREFVPGNMIYANSGRFRVTRYHLPVDEDSVDPVDYRVDLENERIWESNDEASDTSYANVEEEDITGIAMCDVDITYFSRISDEEVHRFQMPVNIMGYLKKGHRGLRAYRVGDHELQHIFGQHTRLVNVGPTSQVEQGELGYPVCKVCGHAESPLSSESNLNNFREKHPKTEGVEADNIAFYADTKVDSLLFQGLQGKSEAVNLAEAVRIGASRVLEMDMEDLQILLLPQEDESYHALLYDPMPGGSGLLQQIVEGWSEVLESAKEALDDCAGDCESSCYQCMRTYRNIFFHGMLDRFTASELVGQWQGEPKFQREVEPREELNTPDEGHPTNVGEKSLGEMLRQAGFPEFEDQHPIKIGQPFKRTIPDLYYEDPSGFPRVAIYLDGLSENIHGNADARKRDTIIRRQLQAEGVTVIEIARSELDDPESMQQNYRRIAFALQRPELAEKSQ